MGLPGFEGCVVRVTSIVTSITKHDTHLFLSFPVELLGNTTQHTNNHSETYYCIPRRPRIDDIYEGCRKALCKTLLLCTYLLLSISMLHVHHLPSHGSGLWLHPCPAQEDSPSENIQFRHIDMGGARLSSSTLGRATTAHTSTLEQNRNFSKPHRTARMYPLST